MNFLDHNRVTNISFISDTIVPESRSGKVHTVACEGSVAQLKCVQGRVISVQSAVYGRRDKTTCATGLISVQSAVYGRRDKTTCATGRPASQIQNVRCSSQSKRVAESCNGKSSCSINVRNSVFGDPCPGTYKYLELAYTCQSVMGKAAVPSMCQTLCLETPVLALTSTWSWLTHVNPLSNSSPVQLSSTQFKLIHKMHKMCLVCVYKQVQNAFVLKMLCRQKMVESRHCKKKMYKKCGPFYYLHQSLYSLTLTCIHRCNGRKFCNIRARNSVFGDPCVGTYKYLRVVAQLPSWAVSLLVKS
ncbi:L-rhamnose-binding lectin CSL3-like [Odontesthes bonariensis]|uniref:L-rhamnose-binding lectin CSL3-like n=1 Tax=Odontesthes bonariensis TaxID=219752 RepID=UPI003F58D130